MVTKRGDAQLLFIDKWGGRAVDLLLLVIPSLLIGGIVLQRLGVHDHSMRFAMAAIGAVLSLTGVLAVAMIVWGMFQKSRQTELSEFLSFEN